MNHPKAVEVLCDRIGYDRPWIYANYNLGGVRMNPSCADIAASFASGRSRNIAMSGFSSAQASPVRRLDHVINASKTGGVDVIMFGFASVSNIRINVCAILREV